MPHLSEKATHTIKSKQKGRMEKQSRLDKQQLRKQYGILAQQIYATPIKKPNPTPHIPPKSEDNRPSKKPPLPPTPIAVKATEAETATLQLLDIDTLIREAREVENLIHKVYIQQARMLMIFRKKTYC